jgi:type II secretory pathway component GspD/PulD (secretin)
MLPLICRCALMCLVAMAMLVAGSADAFGQRSLRHAFEERPRAVRQASSTEEESEAVEIELEQPDAEPTNPLETDELEIDDVEQSEALPEPQLKARLPLADSGDGEVQLSASKNGRITLIVRDASLSRVLSLLAQAHNLNIVAANDIDAIISITLRDVPLEEALSAILSVANYTWVERNNIILITSLTDAGNLPADVQGRQIQVFNLDFVSAPVVAQSVENFLSPIGKVTIAESSPTDNRLTQERIVVEDLPESLARIADFICQIDRPPRQVQIEAHILQVILTDDIRCGVDFHALFRVAGSNVNVFSLPSLASATGSGGIGIPNPEAPAFVATLTSHDLQAVIDALETTTDSKTLGSPKLLVLNGQEANIQVGETIYFEQTTATETSSMQSAGSVETGVILRLTPRITQDGCVLLRVEPEVSNPTGERTSTTLPPNIARIELQSDVMLRDGEGMIIGGLIDERDATNQQKIPYLGDVKGVGWLFRHTSVEKQRREIIFALVPRIQPYDAEWAEFEQGELVRTQMPLFEGPLKRTYRPWDPILPDGKRVSKPLIPKNHKHKHRPTVNQRRIASQYIVPTHPLPQQNFYGNSCESGACERGAYEVVERSPELAQPPGGAFLSEETLPVQEFDDSTLQVDEIITDQN